MNREPRFNDQSGPSVDLLQVLGNEQVAEGVYRMTLSGPLVQRMDWPGQFVHVKCGEESLPLLRRPISICNVDDERQTMTMIYRVEGEGTRILSRMVPEQKLDVLGPLGHGFPIRHRQAGEHAVLVGGGVGVPPLYYLGRELGKRGVRVTYVIGFAGAGNVFLEKELASLGRVFVTTLDGTYGDKGLVTDVLDSDAVGDWDVLYACGPTPMLKALQNRFGHSDIEAYISVEQRMGCGVGACLACVCTPSQEQSEMTGRNYFKICTDGPVFGLREVVLHG